MFRGHEEYLFQSGGSCSRRETDRGDRDESIVSVALLPFLVSSLTEKKRGENLVCVVEVHND